MKAGDKLSGIEFVFEGGSVVDFSARFLKYDFLFHAAEDPQVKFRFTSSAKVMGKQFRLFGVVAGRSGNVVRVSSPRLMKCGEAKFVTWRGKRVRVA